MTVPGVRHGRNSVSGVLEPVIKTRHQDSKSLAAIVGLARSQKSE